VSCTSWCYAFSNVRSVVKLQRSRGTILLVRTLNPAKEDTTKDLVQDTDRLDLDRVTYEPSASSRRIEGIKGFGISSILMNAPAVTTGATSLFLIRPTNLPLPAPGQGA
jgi:hypothetical protein